MRRVWALVRYLPPDAALWRERGQEVIQEPAEPVRQPVETDPRRIMAFFRGDRLH